MVEKTRIPAEFVEGGEVEKQVLTGIDEIQSMKVPPKTTITRHDHEDNQWEVWASIKNRFAYICLKGEEHELVNKSDKPLMIMAIKGHNDLTYEEFAEIFGSWGFSVYHGSILIDYQ